MMYVLLVTKKLWQSIVIPVPKGRLEATATKYMTRYSNLNDKSMSLSFHLN